MKWFFCFFALFSPLTLALHNDFYGHNKCLAGSKNTFETRTENNKSVYVCVFNYEGCEKSECGGYAYSQGLCEPGICRKWSVAKDECEVYFP